MLLALTALAEMLLFHLIIWTLSSLYTIAIRRSSSAFPRPIDVSQALLFASFPSFLSILSFIWRKSFEPSSVHLPAALQGWLATNSPQALKMAKTILEAPMQESAKDVVTAAGSVISLSGAGIGRPSKAALLPTDLYCFYSSTWLS